MQTQKPPSQAPPTTQLKLSQLIKLILQFLQQQNFPQTFSTLQNESKTSLNIVDKAALQSHILESQWQALFRSLLYVTLSEETLFDLYELVVDDLIERDAFQAAGFVVRERLGGLAEGNRERVLRLEFICENREQKAMYHKPPTLTRRENIISRILKQTHQEVQKSRLLTLITSALKFQASKGLIVPNLAYSILEGRTNKVETETEQIISKIDKVLKYHEETKITCMAMSNGGDYIALGGIDGLIQLYEPVTYTLDTSSLKYQAEGIMLYHEHPVSHLLFSQTDELLLTADTKNTLKIWNTQTGRLLRKLDHPTTVGCVSWGIDSSQILLGYQNVQLWGIRGCNLLKEYVCGAGGTGGTGVGEYLMDVFVGDGEVGGSRVFAFGQLGTIRAFNYKTQQQINTLHINSQQHGQPLKILHCPQQSGQQIFQICLPQSILTLNYNLEQLSKHEINGSGDLIQLRNAVFTDFYVYQCVRKETGKFVLQVRDRGTWRVVSRRDLEAGVEIMGVHARRNLLVLYGDDNVLSFWRP